MHVWSAAYHRSSFISMKYYSSFEKKNFFVSFVFPKSWSWVQTRSDYGTGSWHRWRVSLFTDSTGSILFPQNINSLFLHYNTVVTKHTVRLFLGNIDAHTALRNGFSQSEVEPERFVTLWQHRVHKWGQRIGVKPRPRRRRTAAEKPALFLFLEDIFFSPPIYYQIKYIYTMTMWSGPSVRQQHGDTHH